MEIRQSFPRFQVARPPMPTRTHNPAAPRRPALASCQSTPVASYGKEKKLALANALTPERHNGPAQRRSGELRLWPRSHRSSTLLCHGLEFSQHFVDEHFNIGKDTPRSGKRPQAGWRFPYSGLDAGKATIRLDARLSGHRLY